MVITGVGSRETPPEVLAQMTRIGTWCRENKVGVRSGHAGGADWAFEQGAQEFCIAYVPWASFNKELESAAKKMVYEPSNEAWQIVFRLHPAPFRLSRGARLMHGRNTWQVLGKELSNPSDALVCWTPKGQVTGGTATAIRLAQEHNVPVFNLALVEPDEVIRALEELLKTRSG